MVGCAKPEVLALFRINPDPRKISTKVSVDFHGVAINSEEEMENYSNKFPVPKTLIGTGISECLYPLDPEASRIPDIQRQEKV